MASVSLKISMLYKVYLAPGRIPPRALSRRFQPCSKQDNGSQRTP